MRGAGARRRVSGGGRVRLLPAARAARVDAVLLAVSQSRALCIYVCGLRWMSAVMSAEERELHLKKMSGVLVSLLTKEENRHQKWLSPFHPASDKGAAAVQTPAAGGKKRR